MAVATGCHDYIHFVDAHFHKEDPIAGFDTGNSCFLSDFPRRAICVEAAHVRDAFVGVLAMGFIDTADLML